MNPVLALIITNIIWGAASPIFKYALTNIPPFTLAFIRFFFASLLLVPFVSQLNLRGLTKKDWLELLGAGFFGITINISFFFLGVQRTTSINVPVIASTGPLFIFLFSVIFLHEKPRIRVLLGMLVAFLGAMVIIFSPIILNGGTITDFGEFEGNLMIVVATIGAVVHPLLLKNVLKKINVYQATLINFVFAALTFLPLMLVELNSWRFSQLNLAGWTGIIFGVIFSSGLAYFLFAYGLSKLQAQEIGLFTYIDPVAAVVIAIPLLGEYPDLFYLIGSLLVFGGIFYAEGRIHWHPITMLKTVKLQMINDKSTS